MTEQQIINQMARDGEISETQHKLNQAMAALERISHSCLIDFPDGLTWAQWCRAVALDVTNPYDNHES